MKGKMNSILRIAVFTCVFFTFTYCVAVNAVVAATRGVTDTEIRIGTVTDFSGPAAAGCRNSVWAIGKYFEDINNAGGIHGRKIKCHTQLHELPLVKVARV